MRPRAATRGTARGFPLLRALAALATALSAAALGAGAASAAPERHWLAPEAVPGVEPISGQPALAMTPAGEAVLAWSREGADPAVLASVRPAGATAWPAPVRLSAPCPASARPCLHHSVDVAVNAAGAMAVAWILGTGAPLTGNVVTVAERPAGTASWSAPAVLSRPSDSVLSADLGIDGAGAATVVWNEAGGDAFATRRPPGSAWEPPRLISAGERTGSARVATGAGGDALATWNAVSSCRPTAARRRAGGDWEPPIALDPAPVICSAPVEPWIGPDGEALAVWDGRVDVDDVLLSSSSGPRSTAWSAPAALGRSDGLGLAEPPRLAPGPAGALDAVWRDDLGRALTSRRHEDGSWEPASELPELESQLDGGPAPAAGGDGSLVIVAGADGPRPFRALVRGPRGALGAPQAIGPGAVLGAAAPRVAAHAGGEAVAAWRSGNGILTADYTARPGPEFAVSPPVVSALRAPARVPAGAVVPLEATTGTPTFESPVVIERRFGRGWRPAGRALLTSRPSGEVRLRAPRPGVLRLRLRVVGAEAAKSISPAVTVRVVRPSRPRIAVGPGPLQIAVGAGSVWVLGEGAAGATVHRLDPRTGRPRGVVLVGGRPTSIGAGADALWVVRDGRELVRVDPASGTITATRRFCGAARVIARAAGVWVTGACVPGEPRVGYLRDRAVAYRVHPVSAAPVGAPVRIPGAFADNAALFGSTLWLWGGSEEDYDDTAIARVDTRTGAAGPPRTFSGRFGVPLVPVSAREVWTNGPASIVTSLPRAGRPIVDGLRGGYPRRRFVLAPSGDRVWALESRRGRGGDLVRRLVSFALPSGRLRGPTRALGRTPSTPPLLLDAAALAIGAGAAWVLLPAEGAVIRVPIGPGPRR